MLQLFSGKADADALDLAACLGADARRVCQNERQRGCAVRAADAVGEASASLFAGETLDVCYALLDEALGALYELSGEDASEEVIDAVFREFCVGK